VVNPDGGIYGVADKRCFFSTILKTSMSDKNRNLSQLEEENIRLRKELAIAHGRNHDADIDEVLRTLFMTSLDLICEVKMDTAIFTRINPAFNHVLGYSDDEILGHSYLEFIHPDDINRTAKEAEEELIKGKNVIHFENRYRAKAGHYIWLEWVSSPNFDTGFTVAIARDITERKNAEKALTESEEKLRGLYDLSPIGIALTSMDGQYIDYNQAFQNICGYPKEELNKLDYWALTPKKYESEELKQLESLQKHRKYGPYEKEYIRKDGTPIPIRLNGMLVTGKDSKEYIWSLVEDISESKAAEDKLRKLSRAIEQAGESVIITDKQGTIEYVNSSFTKITGYLAEEVLGKNPRVLKSGNQNPEYYTRLWKTITSGKVWQRAIVDRRKDGTQYPALMTISPILNEGGEVTHYVSVQQDMTAHATLEEKFRQAQKMEALGILVGGIAHDFNNMLAGMTGNLYLAKKKVENLPDVIEKLDNTLKLSFRAAEMIKNLLVFARKDTVQMKPFGLTSFIKQASKLCETSLPESIEINNEYSNEKLMVMGDATQLQQVLMNLLNNSRDALIGVSNPTVSIKLEAFEADEMFLNKHPDSGSKTFAHLIVRDNGCGISDGDLQRVFEPFYTNKEVGKGTGLGLSMVYGAIESHGGIIEIESAIKSGTSVHIYIPLLKKQKAEIVSEEDSEMASVSGELILVVDDDIDIKNTTKEVLESLGYQVLEASNGLEAIEQFTANSETVSLIIMDVVMPKMGGAKAFDQIKKIRSDAKVIFATGYDKDESLRDEMPSDENTIISKPYDIIKLSQLIRDMIDS